MCCAEMDIWEANREAQAFTTHPCKKTGYFTCQGEDCGWNGQCEEGGCAINPYQTGNHNFYGKGSNFAVDTSKPFTVVTQFVTNDGTDYGHVTEIRRHYVQNGKVIQTPQGTWSGIQNYNSVSDNFCDA